MEITCDFCGSLSHKALYKPFNSKKNSEIVICDNCGSCFSKYGIFDIKVSEYFGAAFGGHRSGKTMTFEELISDMLNAKVLGSKEMIENCLIVGGQDVSDFIDELIKHFKTIHIIEPEERFKFVQRPNVVGFLTKYEDFFSDTKYQCILVPHTLEHLDSVKHFLKKVNELLTDEGLIYISVPDLAILDFYSPNITEYFLDKHKHHFSLSTLSRYLESSGFEVVKSYFSSKSNFRSLSLICKKRFLVKATCLISFDQTALGFVKKYSINMKADLAILEKKIERLNNVE
jgi:hypothetical protein